jgi:hypothetical protein
MLLTQQLRQFRAGFQRRRRAALPLSPSQTARRHFNLRGFPVAVDALLCPGFAMQYCNNSEIVIFIPLERRDDLREPP